MSEVRMLLLSSGPAFLDSVAFRSRYESMGEYFCGDIVTPVLKSECSNNTQVGRFKVHPFFYYEGNSILRNLHALSRALIYSLRIYRECKYDIIVSSNPLTTGFTALLLSKLTGAKTIIEVNGNFESSFNFGGKGKVLPGVFELIKEKISRALIWFSLKRTDAVKLVYKDQLRPLSSSLANLKTFSFANFVPIARFIEHPKSDGKYILLLGYPWYLKGVDILIKAFNIISDQFPDYRLKVVGWCPEGKEFFVDLANGNKNIELCDPVPYEEVIPLMAGCSLYVLASRTDSSPRVLREAMACSKPIIASNVDGVPALIKDGYNGLLFEKEDAEDLAEKMRRLLDDTELSQMLAKNGLEYVQQYLSEGVYVENYRKMVEHTLAGSMKKVAEGY